MKSLILGGYGHFGRLIARALAAADGIGVVVAGRDGERARALAEQLRCGHARIDANDPALADRLSATGASLVISTAGPFQGQDYRVARAAIDAGAHYIDIADGRDFVCGIGELDDAARAKGVLVVSGASSVPALSGAVVDRHAGDFARLDEIDIGICTSARIPGSATVRAVLGYCGRPIPRWKNGAWQQGRGWLGLRAHRFREGFTRWLCDADVPDLALFPRRYQGVRSVRFGAGLAPAPLHLGLWGLAWMARARVVPDLWLQASALARLGRRFEAWGSDRSAMFVVLRGTDRLGSPLEKCWELVAERHEGANIPCMAAVSLARRLARGAVRERGARPCVGLVSLDDYLAELRPFAVRWSVAPE